MNKEGSKWSSRLLKEESKNKEKCSNNKNNKEKDSNKLFPGINNKKNKLMSNI